MTTTETKSNDARDRMHSLVRRKRLRGRLFKNIHTGRLVIVTLQRWNHIYYAGDEMKGCQRETIFPRNFIKVA